MDALQTTVPGYAHLDSQFNRVPPGTGRGGYVVPEVFVRELRKIDSYWRRRERKARRRYQHQKRKQ